jgi:hypothetical protein
LKGNPLKHFYMNRISTVVLALISIISMVHCSGIQGQGENNQADAKGDKTPKGNSFQGKISMDTDNASLAEVLYKVTKINDSISFNAVDLSLTPKLSLHVKDVTVDEFFAALMKQLPDTIAGYIMREYPPGVVLQLHPYGQHPPKDYETRGRIKVVK